MAMANDRLRTPRKWEWLIQTEPSSLVWSDDAVTGASIQKKMVCGWKCGWLSIPGLVMGGRAVCSS